MGFSPMVGRSVVVDGCTSTCGSVVVPGIRVAVDAVNVVDAAVPGSVDVTSNIVTISSEKIILQNIMMKERIEVLGTTSRCCRLQFQYYQSQVTNVPSTRLQLQLRQIRELSLATVLVGVDNSYFVVR